MPEQRPSAGEADPPDHPDALDEARRRRRDRVDRRRDVPRPTSLDPREGRQLRARAAATDRSERFAERLQAVRRDVARRRRRAQLIAVLSRVGVLLVGILAAVILRSIFDVERTIALAGGVGTAVLVPIVHASTSRSAQRRGAQAWDWQTGRHRLFGKPADRVQQADRPPAHDPRG